MDLDRFIGVIDIAQISIEDVDRSLWIRSRLTVSGKIFSTADQVLHGEAYIKVVVLKLVFVHCHEIIWQIRT